MVPEVAQRLQNGGTAVKFANLRSQRQLTFEPDKLIEQKLAHERPGNAVVSNAALLPAFHTLAMPIPEVGRQLQDARIKQVGVFNDLIIEIVLSPQTQGAGLDAHVDVFGHQDDIAIGPSLLQCVDHTEDLIVSLGRCQA